MAKGCLRNTLRHLSASYQQVWASSHNYRMSAADHKRHYWSVQTLLWAEKFIQVAKSAENDWVAQWAIKEFMSQSVTGLEDKIKWFRDLPKFLKSDQKSYHEFCGSIIGFITQAILAKNQQANPVVVEEQPAPKPECPAGSKYDVGKRRFSLLPLESVNEVVDVLEIGAQKYAVDNWKHVPEARQRYYDAALRHIFAWFNGEKLDPETGKHHLAHGICCLTFLLWMDLKGKL